MRLISSIIALVVASASVMACGNNNKKGENMTSERMEQMVVEELKAIETGAQEPVAYINAESYTQHNPGIADGLDGLGAALANLTQAGIEMKYDTLHKVLGKGNFVLTVSEGYFGGVHTSYYDLFRIENGKIAEHWDVIENILPEAQRANSNGKFGFAE